MSGLLLPHLSIALPQREGAPRLAFTLIEMMIAMAVTMLLMAALARAFSFVGESIRDSRAQVELTNDLRDTCNRLEFELASCTVSLRPTLTENSPQGYFMYYEGPVTDATSSIFLATPGAQGGAEIAESRYGDFDDVLAFTAVASGDNWFTGKVPRFVLDQKTAELNNVAYNPGDFGGNPWDAVVIQSKYAEIIYFASPEYETDSLPSSPRAIDVDSLSDFGIGSGANGLPDNIRLHRRVLLIRPDLNLANGFLQSRDFTIGGQAFPFLRADSWPTATTQTVVAGAQLDDGWLYGMCGVHQQCDLSLRRVLDPATGLPTQNVAANSLSELAMPHNRFGHVRVPGNLIGVGAGATSMPVLALGPPARVLSTLPIISPPRSPVAAEPVVTPNILSGFFRPEFVLGSDLTHPFSPDAEWGPQRLGEDVVAVNVLAFDLQIFDRQARIITTTNGEVVRSSDPGYREAIRNNGGGNLLKGDFVDLMFPVLAGGSIRGWQSRQLDRLQPADSSIPDLDLMVTDFSGLRMFYNSLNLSATNAYRPELYKSGKVLVDGAGQLRVFQPTFDTFTFAYENDGLRQGSGPGNGTRWFLGTPAIDTFDQGASGLNIGFGGSFSADNFMERETAPPFITCPDAIQVSIRLENPLNRQLRQMSVVHRQRH